ncbi:long-chain-fatty-acid--CoA ligase [Novosphingobium rosa]|uniref:long-chain-fatty-acid--CoA ligase n=1 Tax=Novosphingobium rosa TaxID=76978 RepID=UPI000835EFB4|nr:long-chain-fatty-acid--CoA ligase [Novosphingobium rosa]
MGDAFGLAHDRLTTLWDELAYHASATPDRAALAFAGRTTTYAALHDQSEAMATRLIAAGFGPGDRIGYLGKNSDSYFVLLYAVARIGLVLVPLNWRLAEAEMAFIVADAAMRSLYADAAFLAMASRLAAREDIPAMLLDYAALLPRSRVALPPFVADPHRIVFQVYTSGTTGRPKGAMLTHANMLALRAPGYRAGFAWFPRRDDTVALVLPVAHIAGTAYALFGLYAGAQVAITSEFDPPGVLALIERHRVSHILLAPAAMQLLMQHPGVERRDLSSLKFITYGAAPIAEALLRAAMALFGCDFIQMYGMTEAAGGVVALSPEDHLSSQADRLRSAGRAMPGVELAVVDDEWGSLPAGQIGEIAIRSPSVMAGYWRRPDADVEVLRPDGWMRTGDIGRMDAEGYLYVLDRAKDTIITGGENVYPAEVENAIFGHPAVLDVAVVSAPSVTWGEDVVAILVPRPGTAAPTLVEIRAWLEGRIARFKMPRRVVLAATLPRNAGNKLLRRELRAPFWAEEKGAVG